VATVAVKEFIFKQPVQVGDVLSFYTDLVRIGTPRSLSPSRSTPSAGPPTPRSSR